MNTSQPDEAHPHSPTEQAQSERSHELQSSEERGTCLYIVRHTDVYNPEDVLYGRLPRFGLSELGREQARNTARAMAREPVDIFYTSPRLRARQTTSIIAASHPGVPVRRTRYLDEVLTSWQGRPHSDLEKHGFNFYHNRLHPSDETLEQVWERVEAFVRMARRRHPGQTVVGVTHGDILMAARAIYLSLPASIESLRLPHLYAGKGSITRLTFPADLCETYPLGVEYYDPNSQGEPWSQGWVALESGKGLLAG